MTRKVMEELLPARYMPGAVAERGNMSETGWQLPPNMCVCVCVCTVTHTLEHTNMPTPNVFN